MKLFQQPFKSSRNVRLFGRGIACGREVLQVIGHFGRRESHECGGDVEGRGRKLKWMGSTEANRSSLPFKTGENLIGISTRPSIRTLFLSFWLGRKDTKMKLFGTHLRWRFLACEFATLRIALYHEVQGLGRIQVFAMQAIQ